jgi:hypothetical protein
VSGGVGGGGGFLDQGSRASAVGGYFHLGTGVAALGKGESEGCHLHLLAGF